MPDTYYGPRAGGPSGNSPRPSTGGQEAVQYQNQQMGPLPGRPAETAEQAFFVSFPSLVDAEDAGYFNYDSGYSGYAGTFEEQLLGLDRGENPLSAILNRNGAPAYIPPGEYGAIPETFSGG